MERKSGEDSYKQIRYTQLHFGVRMVEDTALVRHKTSALRGGIGEMLLRGNCIADRNCEMCGFAHECIVQRFMYSEFEGAPDFAQGRTSVGYIIFCNDKRKEFRAGDLLTFTVTLFGKTIVYFSQILNAVHMLGVLGLGKNESRFRIAFVRNLCGEPILMDDKILMDRYKWETLGEYISLRKKSIADQDAEMVLQFGSPVSIKYRGELLHKISEQAFADSLWRRLYMLALFEGLDMDRNRPERADFPEITDQRMKWRENPRYSRHQDSFMCLEGCIGTIRMAHISDLWLELLLAGEITHIGKNTSFGFGKYNVVPASE